VPEPVDLKDALDARMAEAWDAYAKAMIKGRESLQVEDGLAAGRLYREFIELFLLPEQRDELNRARAVVRDRVSTTPEARA
jgi:hypothetical protein